MRINSYEPITWKTFPPQKIDDFRCMACGEDLATMKVSYTTDTDLTLTVCVCKTCLELGAEHINMFF